MYDTPQDLENEKEYFKAQYLKQLQFTKRLFFIAMVIIAPLIYWNVYLQVFRPNAKSFDGLPIHTDEYIPFAKGDAHVH